mgnify:CR=1 FL=1
MISFRMLIEIDQNSLKTHQLWTKLRHSVTSNSIAWRLMFILVRTKFHYFILLLMASKVSFSLNARMIKKIKEKKAEKFFGPFDHKKNDEEDDKISIMTS